MAARKNATATGAGVLRPDQFARHVRLERSDCAADLAPWVENYWSLRWQLPAGASYLSSTLPHPACTLSVERGHRRDGIGADAVVVTGVITRRFDVTVRDEGWVFGVKFRPGGLASLAGVNARELRDVTVPASEIFDAATVDELAELGPDALHRRVPLRAVDRARPARDEPGRRLPHAARRRRARCSRTARWCGWPRSRSAAGSAPAPCSGSSSGTSG